MNQTKSRHKITKAAAASFLLVGTATVGLPVPSSAAVSFKDIKKTDFFYEPVMELAAKNVIGGYGDGTFRPYKKVTRGEAAKMLALALNLDVKNATNNSFPDVKANHTYYKYIAALANAGIINGMPDGKFHSEEIVQRSAMSKMIILGYSFATAQNLTHPFKDVSNTNYARYYIQTLLNLGITTGTSAVQFEPNKAVTRGELATFISRASKADAGEPSYVISNVVGNKVYINSVGYTIGNNVKAFIKEANRGVLAGAEIQGTFSGTTLTDISKLTINASGTSTNYYSLDGGSSTYKGELVLNGSYIRLKNWTLNGKTTIAETPRRSLASYNSLSNVLVASSAPSALSIAGIIDWNTPTNPDDSNLNEGSGNINNGSSNTNTYSAKLTPTEKTIDFTNVIVRNLIIEQNRTLILAQTKLPKVTIQRDVAFAEIRANMGALYLDGDDSLTLYGTHDIDTVYKNSYYSVHFNTDSEISTLIVDNSHGWIDLGDFVYIDKVIIPPNTTPNDIFDDYKNDNDNIGIIEDNTGEEVDRDPIGNGVVPDVTKPIINSLTLVPDSNKVTGTITVNETGKYYVIVQPKGQLAPTVREIVQTGVSKQITQADINNDGKYTQTFVYSGLTSVTDYTMYTVHVDDAGNFSAKNEQNFATKDGTPPEFTSAAATGMIGGRRIQFNFKPSETGRYYYFIREAQNVDNTITVDDIISGAQVTGIANADMVANGYSNFVRVDETGKNIKPQTNYVVYAALVDESGNKIAKVKALPVTTASLDEVAPYVTGKTTTTLQQLEPVNTTNLNQFYMYFNEKLDKVTAEDINNYSLSGTGIVNVPGQLPITPASVKYEDYGANGGRVLVTIPSLTGFVHGDTLRVTVSKKVVDLAENPFENVDNAQNGAVPRNFAEYRHIDPYYPDLLINKVERDEAQGKAKITYNASKAGTVYYMVLPDSVDINTLGITKEDFVAEFGNDPTKKFNSSTSGKIYLEGNTTSALKDPLTTELGDHDFVYDYANLSPSTFDSYSVYMVLKDRSGRLSPIVKDTIIADKQAPRISSFNVKPLDNSDTSVKVSLTSENEGGTTYIGYAEKYVLDTDSNSLTYRKHILNDKIYDGSILKEFGNNASLDNATRKQQFLSNVPNVTNRVLEKGANNEYTFTRLKPNTEYVFYIATEDAFGNFTVTTTSLTNNTMIKGVYTDGIKPKIVNNIIYREIDDQLLISSSNNTRFTITFNESLSRKYSDQASNDIGKTNLDQISTITSSTDLDDIVTIKDKLGHDITGQFSLLSYTEGSNITDQSKLVVTTSNPLIVKDNFTVTLNVADQLIDADTANYADEIGKYITPGNSIQNFIYRATLKNDNIITNSIEESTKLDLSIDLGISLNKDGEEMGQKVYYAVVNNVNITNLQADLVNAIINSTGNSKLDNAYNVVSYGNITLQSESTLSFIKEIQAIQYTSTETNVFKSIHNIFVFTKDKYGNIIWAKDHTNQANYHSTIKPKQ